MRLLSTRKRLVAVSDSGERDPTLLERLLVRSLEKQEPHEDLEAFLMSCR